MICKNCGKGELQELTGTALLVCPLCSSKLINPESKIYVQHPTPPDPWQSLTHQEKEQVMQFLQDAAKVKEQFSSYMTPDESWLRKVPYSNQIMELMNDKTKKDYAPGHYSMKEEWNKWYYRREDPLEELIRWTTHEGWRYPDGNTLSVRYDHLLYKIEELMKERVDLESKKVSEGDNDLYQANCKVGRLDGENVLLKKEITELRERLGELVDEISGYIYNETGPEGKDTYEIRALKRKITKAKSFLNPDKTDL